MDQSVDAEAIPPHEVIDFLYGNNIDSHFSIICRGQRFNVRVSASSLRENDETNPSRLEEDYQRLLAAVTNWDTSGIKDLNPQDLDSVSAMYDWITPPFFPLFRKLPPAIERLQTLEEYSNPPTSHFILKSVVGQLTAVASPESSDDALPLIELQKVSASLIRQDVPSISPKNVLIPWDSLSEGASYPRIILLENGQKYFFKSLMADPSREIDILHQILVSRLHERHRISRLHAYVKYADDDEISGFLLQYINHKGTLAGRYAASASVALRQKWYQKVADVVTALHGAGIVWGDVKAENVLIDQEDTVWVIDFGGGYTKGCVDEDKKETVAGDLQGLASIKNELGLN